MRLIPHIVFKLDGTIAQFFTLKKTNEDYQYGGAGGRYVDMLITVGDTAEIYSM